MRTLIRNVALYDGQTFFEDGFLLIDGGLIADSGAALNAYPQADAVIDGRGGLCMPGLINAHAHAAMTLLRGVGSDLPLREWLEQIWRFEAGLTGEAVYWGTMLAIAEMLRHGITAFADMYFFMDQSARAVAESGIRANLVRSATAGDREAVDEGIALFRQWNGACGGRIRSSLCLHSEYTTDKAMVRRVRDGAQALNADVHLHLSETEREVAECRARHGVSPVQYFEEMGLLQCRVLAAHCVWVDARDIETLASRGVSVAHNPISNLKLGSGVAPVAEMIAAGVNVALGTDGPASNNQLDLFSEMRMAAILQKGIYKDPARITAAQALHMGTAAGARALGFDRLGTLAPGMAADLILLDPEAENLSSRVDRVSDLLYSAQGLNVRLTMVDGRVLYRDGELLTIDSEKTLRMARSHQSKLLARMM